MKAIVLFERLGYNIFEGEYTVSCYSKDGNKYCIYNKLSKTVTSHGLFNKSEINAHIQMVKELGIIEPVRFKEVIVSSDDLIQVKAFVCPTCEGIVDITDLYCKHCGEKFEEWI